MPSGQTGAACPLQICFLQGDMKRQSVKKKGVLITIITKLRHIAEKTKSKQNQATSIYMIQVRRKETNLPVHNVSCEQHTGQASVL